MATIQELVRAQIPSLTDDALEHLVWSHTGYPSFWRIGLDGSTPEECFKKQVADFATKYPDGNCHGECVKEMDEAIGEYKKQTIISKVQKLSTEAARMKADIKKLFLDAEFYNEHYRPQEDLPINPDPQGILARILEAIA